MIDEESLDLMYKYIKLNKADKVSEMLNSEPDIMNEHLGSVSWPFLAVRENSLDALKVLVENGVPVDMRGGDYDRSLLCEATANDNVKIAEYLIEAGAKVDEYEELQSPLLYAVMENSLACVNLLVNHGVDLDHVYRFATADMTVVEFAKRCNRTDLLTLFEKIINHEEIPEDMIASNVKEKILTDDDMLDDEEEESEEESDEEMIEDQDEQDAPNGSLSPSEQEELLLLKQEFTKGAIAWFEQLTEDKCRTLLDDLSVFLWEVKARVEKDQEEELDIRQIMILIQNTEYYFGNYVFRIQAFKEESSLKEEFYGKNTDARWIIEPFFDFEQKIKKFQEKYSKTTEWRIIECRKMLTTYLKFASYYLQYIVRDFCIKEENQKLFWADELIIWFGQCAGNWYPVYARRVINIPDDITEGKNYRFIRFKSQKWKRQNWKEIDFSKAIFENCQFQNMTLDTCKWNNAIFKNCIFNNVTWNGGSVYGSTFTNCRFHDVTTNEVQHTKERYDEEGIFKATEFINCGEEIYAIF